MSSDSNNIDQMKPSKRFFGSNKYLKPNRPLSKIADPTTANLINSSSSLKGHMIGELTVNAETEVTSEIVKNFHLNRLLFIIIGNKIFAETNPSGLSHVDWLKTLDFSEVIEPYSSLDVIKDKAFIIDNFTRGYYYRDQVVLYSGQNFVVNNLVIDNLRYNLDLLIEAFSLNNLTKVGIGCIPVKDSVFKIKNELGSIKDLKELTDFTKLYKLSVSYIEEVK